MTDNCLIWSRKTSRWPTVPVSIMPVSPAMVASCMDSENSRAWEIAVCRLT
jgi:hypothetical protein